MTDQPTKRGEDFTAIVGPVLLAIGGAILGLLFAPRNRPQKDNTVGVAYSYDTDFDFTGTTFKRGDK